MGDPRLFFRHDGWLIVVLVEKEKRRVSDRRLQDRVEE